MKNRVKDYLGFAFCMIIWAILYFVFYTSGIKLVYDRSTSWKEQMTWY